MTPEPSTLSDQELQSLAEYCGDQLHSDVDSLSGELRCECSFCRRWRLFLRLIAQARAAQSALDHAAVSLDRYNEANAALQHIVACQPYLKEGEYPEECIERWRQDCDALMTVLAQRTKELEEARAARPSPWQPIETAPKDGSLFRGRSVVEESCRWSADGGEWLTYDDRPANITEWQPATPAQDGGRP